MNDENLVYLLLIDESPNDADRYVSVLRAAGFAIRATRVEDEEDMQEALNKESFDLAICAVKLSYFNVGGALKTLASTDKDIPLVVATNSDSVNEHFELLKAGARNTFQKDNRSQLVHVITRELEDLRARRSLRINEQRYKELERRNRALLGSSRDAITYIHEGMHVYANSSYLNMFGYHDQGDIEGMPILDMIAPEHYQDFKEFFRNYQKGKIENNILSVSGRKSDGSTFNAELEFDSASIDGEPCTQIIIRDQSINKELEKKLKSLSNQDLLTGLFNRQYFIEELEIAVSKAVKKESESSLVYIALDNFRNITENVGIAASDLVISDFASHLQGLIREQDLLARFGDHIFTILVQSGKLKQVEAYAQKIRQAVEQYVSESAGQSVVTTCSIGISLISEKSNSAQEILSRADVVCEKVQDEGGNQVRVHNPVSDSQADLAKDRQWLVRMKTALKNNQFRLVYQPIVSLTGSSEENYQVLVRMINEDGDLILPGEFLPIAENHNVMPYIDRWVIDHALRVLAEQSRQGRKTSFFIKISSQSFRDSTLLPWISERMRGAKIPGDRITFELSEAEAVANLKEAKLFLKGLANLKCRSAMSRFGSHPNPMNYLQHLPVLYLKFDREFMTQLASDKKKQERLKQLATELHAKEKITIAEFVESVDSLSILWQSGIDFIQGYFLQEPTSTLTFDFKEQAV